MKNKFKLAAPALAFALLFSACSNQDVKEATNEAETNVEEQADAVEEKIESKTDDIEDSVEGKVNDLKGIQDKEFAVSLDDAVNKFKEAFDDSTIEVSSVELDEDDGRYAYDIQGFKENYEYEAEIDAESGEVISKEEEQDDDDDDRDDDIAIDFVEIISPKEAMEKALENNTGYVKSYEIDHDDDRLVYEIDIEDGDDVELDAKTGDILEK